MRAIVSNSCRAARFPYIQLGRKNDVPRGLDPAFGDAIEQKRCGLAAHSACRLGYHGQTRPKACGPGEIIDSRYSHVAGTV
jgi:hypothetical protein